MRYIELTQGKRTVVDDRDFERASSLKWHYDHGYARRKNGKESLYLHQFILNDSGIDHINSDGLDNRRINLRKCSQANNAKNSSAHRDSKYSKFKGVSFNKVLNYWTATIHVNGKHITKYFKAEIDAAKAYNKLAKEHYGVFAKLNII